MKLRWRLGGREQFDSCLKNCGVGRWRVGKWRVVGEPPPPPPFLTHASPGLSRQYADPTRRASPWLTQAHPSGHGSTLTDPPRTLTHASPPRLVMAVR